MFRCIPLIGVWLIRCIDCIDLTDWVLDSPAHLKRTDSSLRKMGFSVHLYLSICLQGEGILSLLHTLKSRCMCLHLRAWCATQPSGKSCVWKALCLHGWRGTFTGTIHVFKKPCVLHWKFSYVCVCMCGWVCLKIEGNWHQQVSTSLFVSCVCVPLIKAPGYRWSRQGKIKALKYEGWVEFALFGIFFILFWGDRCHVIDCRHGSLSIASVLI